MATMTTASDVINALSTVTDALGPEGAATLMCALAYGNLGAALAAMLPNVGPTEAACIQTARIALENVEKSRPAMESNLQMIERKLLTKAHEYSLAKRGCYLEGGHMINVCKIDAEAIADTAARSIIFDAERLAAASQADAVAASGLIHVALGKA